MNPTLVAAVVLCWNDADAVIALLARLGTMAGGPGLVIVIDNGSTGDDVARLSAAFPAHVVIALPTNVGFASAVNRGIERAQAAGAAWVWLLNSDIDLPVDALTRLFSAAQADPRCGMAAPVLLEPDGSMQAMGGGRVNLWTGASHHVLSAQESCDYLTGACLLLRSSMLRDIGNFDEGYFFYWEDVELSFRAREAGWAMAVAGDCRVVHREGSSLGRWSERRWYLLFRGMKRFLEARSPCPRTSTALRLLHHSAAMARHGRRDAMRGAWRAVTEKRIL